MHIVGVRGGEAPGTSKDSSFNVSVGPGDIQKDAKSRDHVERLTIAATPPSSGHAKQSLR